MFYKLQKLNNQIVALLESFAQPLFLLIIRLWMAKIFFMAGLTKIKSWETTLLLFEYEYAVPLLPSAFAAYSGTAVELVFPVLMAIGLLGRLSAAILFVFNIIAVISYPDINEVGVQLHTFWGALLALTAIFGPGKISIDHFFVKKQKSEYL